MIIGTTSGGFARPITTVTTMLDDIMLLTNNEAAPASATHRKGRTSMNKKFVLMTSGILVSILSIFFAYGAATIFPTGITIYKPDDM